MDSTDVGAGGWKTNVAGVNEYEASLKCYYDASIAYFGAGYLLKPGTAVNLTLNISGGADSYTGTARVTKATVEQPATNIVKIDFDCKGTGALTRPT